MNKQQHEKWLKKHGVSRVQISQAKKRLGKTHNLPSFRDEIQEDHKIRSMAPLSDSIPANGTKDHTEEQFKIQESSKYPSMPAYNKGPVMVVSKSELKYAGKKL